MVVEVSRPLISEILVKVNNAKDKPKKIAVLKQYDSPGLRMVLKSSFDPKIQWRLPEGDVPFKKNDAPAGTEHTRLEQEARTLFHYIKGGNDKLKQIKCEAMFVQLLEGLHESEAEMLIAAKDKRLHQVYKGLSKQVVQESFNWDEDYLDTTHKDYKKSA
jgi:hypothetical protein|tara:strand:+ start:857 stop:1336 length:480 start_codon:yes stop_codon:yes gene_type:complete